MKILLTEGSGLTARQTAGRLRTMGHAVGVASSDSLALTRFTRAVGSRHPIVAFGADPFTWLDAVVNIVRRHNYDMLFPTQEQVTVLSWAAGGPILEGICTAVPSFDSLIAVQDKIAAHATLQRLDIAQPQSEILQDLDEFRQWDRFPVFMKTPIGTATSGVHFIGNRAQLAALAADRAILEVLESDGSGVLAQTPADGPLAMLQTVFDRGRLVAFHANLRVREGARGGASHKRSITQPEARKAMETLGRDLRWHGALSADAILTADGPVIIDVNPRLVEPGNAAKAGVDLVGAMLDVARETSPSSQPAARRDINTHQLLLAVLGAAEDGRGRRGVMAELLGAARHSADYIDSSEELTPLAHDWRTIVPTLAATTATLVKPSTWERFSSGTVTNYAITPQGWQAIRNRQPEWRSSTGCSPPRATARTASRRRRSRRSSASRSASLA